MKTKIKNGWGWVKSHPKTSFFLVILLCIFMYVATSYYSDASAAIGGWWSDRKDEQMQKTSEYHQVESIKNESNSNTYAVQAEAEAEKLGESKERLEKAKEHINEVYKKPTPKPLNPRKYDADDALPSLDNSCERSNRLGIPCDPNNLK